MLFLPPEMKCLSLLPLPHTFLFDPTLLLSFLTLSLFVLKGLIYFRDVYLVEFLDYLSDYYLLKKDSAPCSST
jgi:hypothetical protein